MRGQEKCPCVLRVDKKLQKMSPFNQVATRDNKVTEINEQLIAFVKYTYFQNHKIKMSTKKQFLIHWIVS